MQLAAHHRLSDLARGGVLGDELRRVRAAAQHRDAVGHREDLAQLVGDEDECLALAAELADDREQLVDLLRREHRGRLVEDEQLRSAVQHLQDLDALLQSERDVLDASARLDHDLEALLELADPSFDRAPVEHRSHALVTEHDVLRHGERRHEHEVLVDHPDAERDRVARSGDAYVLAVEADGAGVRVIEAVQDVHEGRLARAVLADERVDLALVHDEVHALQRLQLAETLGDAAHLEKRLGGPFRRACCFH